MISNSSISKQDKSGRIYPIYRVNARFKWNNKQWIEHLLLNSPHYQIRLFSSTQIANHQSKCILKFCLKTWRKYYWTEKPLKNRYSITTEAFSNYFNLGLVTAVQVPIGLADTSVMKGSCCLSDITMTTGFNRLSKVMCGQAKKIWQERKWRSKIEEC